MQYEIGDTAGKIWEYLHSNESATLAELKKQIAAPADLVNQAIGWLARENKLHFEKKANRVKVWLK